MSFSFSVSDFDDVVNSVNKKAPFLIDSVHESSNSRTISLENYSNESKPFALDESLKLTINEPEQYKLQSQIREVFGKGNSLNLSTIADHPDFNSLVYGGTKNQFITTMFVDIKGSTRLSLKYPDSLEFIYKFKNAVIKSCIEIIHAFDGHVHRIMGDAVLGFFGSSYVNKQQSILDCINAAAMLTVILEHTIKPWLQKQKMDFDVKDFGFRVGCNFGDDEEVLWANYGFGTVGEVSPTGLPVDLAAKLQGLANKNQIMMGQGLLSFFNFPKDFSDIKQTQVDHNFESEEYISPNYSKADGTKLNYIMRLLKTHNYILGLPLPLELKAFITDSKVKANEKIIPNEFFELSAEIKLHNQAPIKYYSNSKVIPKESQIKAILTAKNINLNDFYKVIFYKKNQSGLND
ncbi:adenylate/guanylate cyclase domain-containing protein, partial [Acinetobacter sp. 1125_18A]|uniref:adenylate/guanylate cyclase domain-containing protein n=1 Tax=Acinetobacter sp. 1125_18A TaxID=2605959 RepID=UPI0040584D73